MWHALYPGKAVEDVPISHITNGVHLLGWMKGPVRSFWRRKLGPRWEENINSAAYWKRMLDPGFISDEELWALRYRLRRALIEFARRRLEVQGQRLAKVDFIAFDRILDPDALTIGFARRFATYKRAPLVFQDLDRILELVQRPRAADSVRLRGQGPPDGRRRQTPPPADHPADAGAARCAPGLSSSRTTTCMSPARWSRGATSG